MGTVQPIPCLLSMPTRNHMDITTPPLPPVAPEVLRVAEHRHKKGLMYPYIFHVLTKVRRAFSVLPGRYLKWNAFLLPKPGKGGNVYQ